MITPVFSLIFKENSQQKKTLVFSVFYDGFCFSETVPKQTPDSRCYGIIHLRISEVIMSSKPICASGVISLIVASGLRVSSIFSIASS